MLILNISQGKISKEYERVESQEIQVIQIYKLNYEMMV